MWRRGGRTTTSLGHRSFWRGRRSSCSCSCSGCGVLNIICTAEGKIEPLPLKPTRTSNSLQKVEKAQLAQLHNTVFSKLAGAGFVVRGGAFFSFPDSSCPPLRNCRCLVTKEVLQAILVLSRSLSLGIDQGE